MESFSWRETEASAKAVRGSKEVGRVDVEGVSPSWANRLMVLCTSELEKPKIILYSYTMQIISTPHSCLYFKFNKSKFLFGITCSLLLDPAALGKLRPDHVLVPSQPYLPQTSTFLWNFQKVSSICKSLLVPDSPTKKRVEEILEEDDSSEVKWDFFENYQIEEEVVVAALGERLVSPPLASQPLGIGYNSSPELLNVVVPEQGCSLVLIYRTHVFIVDPPQRVQQLLLFYGIPLSALKAVILTNPANFNFFECLLKLLSLQLVATEKTYRVLADRIKTIFCWSAEMLGRRVRARVVGREGKWHRIGPLQCSFVRGGGGEVKFWDIEFGLRRIRVMTGVLSQFPSQVVKQSDLEYLVVREIQPEIKMMLEKSPEAYRKKIIFNRADRKYGNKYFVTLKTKQELLPITSHPHLHHTLSRTPLALSRQFTDNDPNRLFASQKLAHQEILNASQRIVYVQSGYVRNENSVLFGQDSQVENCARLSSQQRSEVLFESQANVSFFDRQLQIDKALHSIADSLLSKVRDNSFIQSLQLLKGRAAREKEGDMYEEGSEWDLVNRCCQGRTLEADSQEVDWGSNFYMVIKGALKFKNSQRVASKNMGIGNIRRFYSSAYQEEDEIQVLKDSWVLQFSLKALHSLFLSCHPQKMYQLFVKPLVFP